MRDNVTLASFASADALHGRGRRYGKLSAPRIDRGSSKFEFAECIAAP